MSESGAGIDSSQADVKDKVKRCDGLKVIFVYGLNEKNILSYSQLPSIEV